METHRNNPVQFKMVSMRSEKPICVPSRLSAVSLTLALKCCPNVVKSLLNVEVGHYTEEEEEEEKNVCAEH